MAKRPPLLLWTLLALPALWWLGEAARMEAVDLEELLAPTGELSARLIVLALAVTPLLMLVPRAGWVRWLARRRRAIGVAAFGYALLHLAFYLVAMGSWRAIAAELGATGIWTGWLAFLLLMPVAAVSNDRSVRWLKAGWKRVQRLAYPAAVLTLVHWIFVHNSTEAALLNFAPLGLLQLFRLVRSLRGRSSGRLEHA